MRYTRENIKDGICAKLDKVFDDECNTARRDLYKEKLLNYPIEVEQNILEWVNDEPLSEVDCYGISIKKVMDEMKLNDKFIPMLINNFIHFEKSGFRNVGLCYRGLLS